MLSSIHPLGERAKGNRWTVTLAAFVVGSVVAGTLAGALVGAAGRAISMLVKPATSIQLGLVVLVVLAMAAFDLRVAGLTLPTIRRQVDEAWLHRYRGWVYGVGYGFQLGLGVITIVPTAAVYGAWLLALLTGSVGGGIIVGATFGLVRGLSLGAGRRVTTASRLRQFHRALDRWGRVTTRMVPLGEVVMAITVLSLIATR